MFLDAKHDSPYRNTLTNVFSVQRLNLIARVRANSVVHFEMFIFPCSRKLVTCYDASRNETRVSGFIYILFHQETYVLYQFFSSDTPREYIEY